MKRIIICLLFSTIILTACSIQKQHDSGDEINNIDKEVSESLKDEKNNDNNVNNTSENKLAESSDEEIQDINTDTFNYTSLEDMKVKVKEYILNGQGEKSEAQKLNWSNSFLEQVNLEEMYYNYLSDGGISSDVEGFAKYITLYAPIPSKWQEIFKRDLYEAYGEQVVKMELIGDDLYQAYVEKEGKEVPYVVVSARTGYFHG